MPVIKKAKFICFAVMLFAAGMLLPEVAHAGGITEFAGPLETVVNTLSGPVGKSICTLMLIVCAVGYWFTRGEELSGVVKVLFGLVFIMVMIAFAPSIVTRLFSFSGAML